MPEASGHTYDLILRLTQDYLKSIRARRMLSFALMGIGVIIVVIGFVMPEEIKGISQIITSAAGVTIGSSSFFPINDTIKLNLKIHTLENLRSDLEHAGAGGTVGAEDASKIEAIVWKLVEQTVVS
ncbi:MAG: hypothetical protein Q8916_05520 [Bacteroidota bacterium]|nr:hypothetical protein [Bacteroidota bacterium]MDP4229849.1 hypothetical protein [Bacteroidota bacterium]MDP4234976.1 hypothetical protein [Bacteroidota bacterium]